MGRPSKKKEKTNRTGSISSKRHSSSQTSHYHSSSLPINNRSAGGEQNNKSSIGPVPRKNILNRLPDYLRDTVDWFIGRSRRGKEQRSNTAPDRMSKRVASASYAVRPQPKSPDSICVCDSIDEKMVSKITEQPHGIEQREWISHNILGMFDHVNALCGTVTEICTPVTCPHMNFPGTSKASYQDERGKRQYYPAMQYVDCVMSQCETMSRQEDIFPTKYGNKFNDNFEPSVKKMLRNLWHCMGHLYTNHWDQLGMLQLRPQCAMVFAHIAEVGRKYNLLDAKDQHNIDATVILVRPILPMMAPNSQTDDADKISGENQRAVRVPSSKSGSWGGYPSPAVLTCKPYAQTC